MYAVLNELGRMALGRMNKKVTRYFEQRFTTLRDFKLGI